MGGSPYIILTADQYTPACPLNNKAINQNYCTKAVPALLANKHCNSKILEYSFPDCL